MAVVITEFMHESAVRYLETRLPTHYAPGLYARPQTLHGLVRDPIGLIVGNKTRVDAALINSQLSLQIVAQLGGKLDNVDREACRARDITIIGAAETNFCTLAEDVITKALVLLRGADGPEVNLDGLDGQEWPHAEGSA